MQPLQLFTQVIGAYKSRGVQCLNANVFIDYASTDLHLQELEATSFKL